MIRPFLVHGSNALLLAAIAALASVFAVGAVHFSLAAALIGAAVFFTSEYTTHRFLFHAKPSGIGWIRKLQHRLHYDHHIDPPNVDLLFLPPWFTIPVTAIYFGLYVVVTRDAVLSLSLTFGSLCALAYYEWVHYVAHVPFVPMTPYGRWIKKYHLWHHFKNEHLWFGVTNPSMDAIAGTFKRVETASRSTTVREIWRDPT